MSTIAQNIVIEEMTVPARVDDADAADLHAVVALNNAVCFAETGLHDFDRTAEEDLPPLRESTDFVQRVLLAREAGIIVGACTVTYATAEPTSIEIDLMVMPDDYGRGIEDALLAAAEDVARAQGRETVQGWTLHRAGQSDEMLTPSTGWGTVPANAHSRFFARNGFAMEQVERNSAFDLQAQDDTLPTVLADALAVAGDDYRLVEWTIPTPPPLRDGYAWALSRMSTDAPNGGLEVDEEVWDAERVARRDARFAASGQTVSVTAIEHVPTGTLAAFNELVISRDHTAVTHQYCTLVLREHRGHRLGVAVKAANILRWSQIAPESPRISTFNAEENRPMLDINEALGFAPVSYAAAWQKRLA